MADDHRRPAALRFDNRGDLAGKIMQGDVLHRSAACLKRAYQALNEAEIAFA